MKSKTQAEKRYLMVHLNLRTWERVLLGWERVLLGWERVIQNDKPFYRIRKKDVVTKPGGTSVFAPPGT